MLSTLAVVLPIFGLILAGWASRRAGVLGPNASSELNRFVVYLALPAVLFDVMANTTLEQIWQPGFVAAFGLACGVVFAGTVLLRLRSSRDLADASIDGLNAAYANAGYMGLPLCLTAFGPGSVTAVVIAMIVTVCLLFVTAIVLIEIGVQSERRASRLLAKVVRGLARNPLLMAPLLGAFFASTGLALPAAAETFLKLLGGAASPCALVALGLFLAQRAPDGMRESAPVWPLVALKMFAQPALTAFLVYRVFTMPPLMANAAVLIAALPTGTGPFMLAEFYGREAVVTSRTILYSTVGSVLTLTALLVWFARG